MSSLNNSSLDNEKDILLQIMDGDQKAFRLLYDTFNPIVYATINRYITDEEECREQLQEVFITLWEKRHLLSGINSLDNYLFIMARNSVIRYVSQLQKQIKLLKQYQNTQADNSQFSGNVLSASTAELREYHFYWQKAIDALPEQQKSIYLLVDQQDHALDEVAASMGLAKETVKKHLKLARKTVRARISSYITGSDPLPEILLLIAASIFF